MQFPDLLRRPFTLFALLAVVLVAFAGCGSDDDDSGSDSGSGDTETTQTETTEEDTETTEGDAADDAAGQVVEVGVVSGQLKFDPEQLDAKAGSVTFKFDNPDNIPHDFVIEQDGKRIDGTDLISQDTAEVTVELEAGEYQYICTPHEAAGMVGTLTVS